MIKEHHLNAFFRINIIHLDIKTLLDSVFIRREKVESFHLLTVQFVQF